MSKFKMLYLPLLVSVSVLNWNVHGAATASSNEDGVRTAASSSSSSSSLTLDRGGIVTKIMEGRGISQTIAVPIATARTRVLTLDETFKKLEIQVPNELLSIMAEYEMPLRFYVLRDKMVSDINLTTGSRVDIPFESYYYYSEILAGTNLYFLNYNSDNISVIDTITNTRVCADIQVGRRPSSATLVGTHLYVLNTSSKNISVIDTTTKTRLGADIQVGSSPSSATLVGTHLYVLNHSDSISVIDTTTKTRLGADIQVGSMPISAVVVGTHLETLN